MCTVLHSAVCCPSHLLSKPETCEAHTEPVLWWQPHSSAWLPTGMSLVTTVSSQRCLTSEARVSPPQETSPVPADQPTGSGRRDGTVYNQQGLGTFLKLQTVLHHGSDLPPWRDCAAALEESCARYFFAAPRTRSFWISDTIPSSSMSRMSSFPGVASQAPAVEAQPSASGFRPPSPGPPCAECPPAPGPTLSSRWLGCSHAACRHSPRSGKQGGSAVVMFFYPIGVMWGCCSVPIIRGK